MTPRRSALDRNRWVWSKTRKFALARDRNRCQLAIPGVCLVVATEVDHILPRALGGDDALDNLRSVCRPCHLGRGMDESGTSGRRYSFGRSHVVTRSYSR